jgi:ABC-type sugar transport system substrate-binding protein
MKFVITLFLILYFSFATAGDKPLHFALFTQRAEGDAFWGVAENFAKATQQQLNVKITVYYAHGSKQKMLENLQIANRDHVDAVLFPNLKMSAYDLIEQAESLHLPVFLFNADIEERHRKTSGNPGQFFHYWLGSMMPDDENAGYLLGKQLIGRARQLTLNEKNGHVYIVAINGTITDSPAIDRLNGLKRAIAEDGNATLQQSVYSFWEKDIARTQATHLHLRYPNVRVFWGASDLISIGISESLSQSGWIQGKDYVTGGIDWSLEGLKAIQKNQIQTSIGGQFMEAAWVVIMLHDYFNGIPLPIENNLKFNSKMVLLPSRSLPILLDRLMHDKWGDIDFRHYSRFYNPQLKEYQLDPTAILKDLESIHNNNQ